MKRKILITSALPYANGPLHFGHLAGAYLPADCYARFQRLQGNEVLYLCGSDEHGVAITLSAEQAKRSPQEHVNYFHQLNLDFFRKLSFSFDHYSRTTWKDHYQLTQEFFKVLRDKGYIEERVENHLYSEQEKRFLADRYVVGICPKCGFDAARGDECPKCGASYEATDLKNPRSKLSGSPLVLRPSAHLYLRFDLFQEQLREWLKSKKWKENVVHFAMSYVNELRPRAITRDSNWGVPVPDMPGKVFYVWFDAPIGYISAAMEWAKTQGKPELWKEFWFDPRTELVHFIGKDNIPFHAVFFPAMLMGQDLPYQLPSELPANEFYLLEGRQFSKSDNWTIDLEKFLSRYTADQIRYAIAANAPETADSDFTWKDFQVRCNAELLGKLGNFVQRVLVFVQQQCHGLVPALDSLTGEDLHFIEQTELYMTALAKCYDCFQLRKACQTLMEIAHTGNSYIDLKKPWHLAKEPSQRAALEKCIACCLHCIKALALGSSPIIPETAQKIWKMLGETSELAKGCWQEILSYILPSKRALPPPNLLFRKVEDTEVQENIENLMKHLPSAAPAAKVVFTPLKEAITIEQFDTVDLRVAQVLEAERVVKSKKLLKLRIDLGFEQRTVVSGIGAFYAPEQLIGKKVILVANLKPATIMGIESQGMVLAGSIEGSLELTQVQNLLAGSVVQ